MIREELLEGQIQHLTDQDSPGVHLVTYLAFAKQLDGVQIDPSFDEHAPDKLAGLFDSLDEDTQRNTFHKLLDVFKAAVETQLDRAKEMRASVEAYKSAVESFSRQTPPLLERLENVPVFDSIAEPVGRDTTLDSSFPF